MEIINKLMLLVRELIRTPTRTFLCLGLIIALVFFTCLPTDAKAETNWWRVSSNTLLIADWMQTLHISKDDNYIETNNVLGEHPERSNVNLYFISMILLNNWIGEKYGDWWYITVTVNQTYYVHHNFTAGVQFSF